MFLSFYGGHFLSFSSQLTLVHQIPSRLPQFISFTDSSIFLLQIHLNHISSLNFLSIFCGSWSVFFHFSFFSLFPVIIFFLHILLFCNCHNPYSLRFFLVSISTTCNSVNIKNMLSNSSFSFIPYLFFFFYFLSFVFIPFSFFFFFFHLSFVFTFIYQFFLFPYPAITFHLSHSSSSSNSSSNTAFSLTLSQSYQAIHSCTNID
ncbi:unnamed protein product [Acanthosepion pharaonis]|uniref:Uncharacterized protein n=1 Tax=Acanthosepion pharaonis TaxID=158019 RepID=A0A812D3X4_ACAPH|nr:unnamed protein product [Sepia pharaonis]